jgi:Fur family ferric uptake transcriptional regulator
MVSLIEQICIEKGLKMTGQRRIVAQVLSTSTDHPNVEELHRRAFALDNEISMATVYRTVRLFEDYGIIEKHDFKSGRARYEVTSDVHHDHLLDLETGKLIEFNDPEIEVLQQKIAEKFGYKLVGHRLELYGIPLPSKNEDNKGHS